MYNRYIPAPDGTYKKHSISDPPRPPTPPPEPPQFHKPSGNGNIGHFLGNLLPAGLDTEDLIVVLLLLLISGWTHVNEQNKAAKRRRTERAVL